MGCKSPTNSETTWKFRFK